MSCEKIDILKVHATILEHFDTIYERVITLKQQLDYISAIKQTEHDTLTIQATINNLKAEIDKNKSMHKKHFYVLETIDLIMRYNKELETPIVFDFLTNTTSSVNEHVKTEIENAYIKIASK